MDGDASDLVTVASYPGLAEAYIARSRLEAAGLFAVVQDEHAGLEGGLHFGSLGGVRVQVHPDDEAQAIEILNAADPSAGEYVDGVPDELAGEVSDRFGPRPGPAPPPPPREVEAGRAITAACLMFVFPPLVLWAIFRLVRVATLDGPLGPYHRRRAWLAAMLVAIFCELAALGVAMYLG